MNTTTDISDLINEIANFVHDTPDWADNDDSIARLAQAYFILTQISGPDMVTDEDMELTLSSLQANLPLAAEQLVQQANDNGGRDNVSVILVRVLKSFPARSGLVDRLKSWFR